MPDLKNTSREIALDVAERMTKPRAEEDSAADHIGAAIVHAVTEPWRPGASALAAARLAAATRALPASIVAGAWSGLGALLFARDAVAHATGGYDRLGRQGLDRIGQYAQDLITQRSRQPEPISRRDIDVISGLAGVGRLLLAAGSDADGPLREILSFLVRAAYRVRLDLGMAHGVTGPLTLLALAHADGVRVDGQIDSVSDLARWLLRHRRTDGLWPASLPERPGPSQPAAVPGWCYGNAGVARALTLAGAVLADRQMTDDAVAALTILAAPGTRVRPFACSTLCHGRAGLLIVTCRAAVETPHPALDTLANQIAAEIIADFDPAAIFGYRHTHADGRTEDSSTLLTGAAGVALALLQYAYPDQPLSWDRPLLTC